MLRKSWNLKAKAAWNLTFSYREWRGVELGWATGGVESIQFYFLTFKSVMYRKQHGLLNVIYSTQIKYLYFDNGYLILKPGWMNWRRKRAFVLPLKSHLGRENLPANNLL